MNYKLKISLLKNKFYKIPNIIIHNLKNPKEQSIL